MKHVTSSPKFSKPNGMLEHAIGIMETLMPKVLEDDGNPNLALNTTVPPNITYHL